jgi:hypothetical protein
MILRELLAKYEMTSINEFSKGAKLTRRHAWNLWHGRSKLGLNLAKNIELRTGIPLELLVKVEPTPPTPPKPKRGKRGRRRSSRRKGERRRASLPTEEEIRPAPPDT